MGKKSTVLVMAAVFFAIVGLGFIALLNSDAAVLHPHGVIAEKEYRLIIFTVILCLFIVIPVYFMLFLFVWKYHASNTRTKYTPDADHNAFLETIWWGFPCLIILILGVVTWRSTYELSPFRALDSTVRPLTIQVVALDWKWLFIYPAQGVATVNYVQFPVKTPINFEITSDAPMNSFWIPRLGGQIYAMSGMTTELHLMADVTGKFNGSSANISGRGFAGMKFVAESAPPVDFDYWIRHLQTERTMLNTAEYARLAKPSVNHPVQTYGNTQGGLYDTIQMKYMSPGMGAHGAAATTMGGM